MRIGYLATSRTGQKLFPSGYLLVLLFLGGADQPEYVTTLNWLSDKLPSRRVRAGSVHESRG